MKNYAFTIITILLTVVSSAQTFTVDGLNYKVTSINPNEVDVTGGSVTENLIIPNTVEQNDVVFNVTGVGNAAFRFKPIVNLVIGDNVINIAANAFRQSGSLETVILGSSVQLIDDLAFDDSRLTSFTSKATDPPSLGEKVFLNSGSQNADFFVPTESISAYQNSDWNSAFAFVFVVGTGEKFIDGGITYQTISIDPNEVRVVENTNTGAITIPDSVTLEGENFTVVAIGASSFQIDGITSVDIPNTVTIIDDFSFRNNDLTNLDIPDSVTFIGRDAFNSNDLVQVIIPNSVTIIDDFAFNANNLTSVTIPISLTAINTEVFARNELTSITIPTNITSIGVKAFFENNLDSVTVESNTPPSVITDVDNDSFDDRSEINLFIPEGTTQAYLDTGWTGFQSVIEVPEISLEIKVFLQGATTNPNVNEEGLMRNDLSFAGLIPTTSPYQDEFIVSVELLEEEGEEGAIVDWVFVELLDIGTNEVIGGTSSLLRRDGFLFTPNFETALAVIEEGSYLMRISHRNHISIQTANPITLDFGAEMFFDFTSNPSFVAGAENALTEVSDGIFAMISGDFDANGQVQPSDVNDTTAAIGTSSYSNADMDMNGQIQPADVNNLVNPNVGRGIQF